MNKNNLYQKIQEIQNLEENWNGYGAATIPLKVIEKAINILQKIDHDFHIISILPTGRESIQFERTDENGKYFELEVFENKIVFYCDFISFGGLEIHDIEQAVNLFSND